MHVCQVRPRSDNRGFDLISDAFRLEGCATASGTQLTMQSVRLSFQPVTPFDHSRLWRIQRRDRKAGAYGRFQRAV